MEKEIKLRRKRIAEEIGDALSDLGITKKEFASRMHRQPSEVTRWMSGNHNFTSDLLEEMSIVLGRPISGAEDRCVPAASSAVSGYGNRDKAEKSLEDPAASFCVDRIQLPESVFFSLSSDAKEKGKTLREYVQEVLCEKAQEKKSSIFDFCGIWAGEEYPTPEELTSHRTIRTYPEL